MAVGIGIDGDRLDAHFRARTNNAHGDFAAIGYEYFFYHALNLRLILIFDTETRKLYHARLMAALPSNSVTINNLDFARKALEIHDTIAVSQFLRLADFLSTDKGALEFRLAGYQDGSNKPSLKLEISGKLHLLCQRCLGPMEYDLDAHATFVIVRDEASIPETEDEADEIDYLVAETHMSVADLIEDEILLSLPLAPKHEIEACDAASKLNELKKPGPFAELQKLKLQGRKTDESQD